MNKKNTIKNKKINQNIEAYLSRFVVTKKTKLRKIKTQILIQNLKARIPYSQLTISKD